MEKKPRIIATVVNDVLYDQRMIRTCSTLAHFFDVELWGRKKFNTKAKHLNFKQVRLRFLINKGPLFYLILNIRFFYRLLSSEFDVVHAVDLDTLVAGFFAAKLKGKKIVYDSHEYFTEVPELIHRPLKKKIWNWIESMLVPRVDAAITVSQPIADIYTKLYKLPFAVVRNCPEVSLLSLEIKSEETPYIIYQGALNKGRGLEALIIAMKDIPIHLKIAGTGDIENELKKLIEIHKLSHKIFFLGVLQPDKLIGITQNAFVGYNSMEKLGLSYYYSLSNKFFDYIQAHVPVITNGFPAYKAINDTYKCCYLSEAQPTKISNAINMLLNNKNAYKELKDNTIIAAKELNWNKEKINLIKIYEKIVS